MKKNKPTYSKMPLYIVSKGKLFYNNREGRFLSDKEVEEYRDKLPNEIVIIKKPIQPTWHSNYDNY